VEDFGRILGGFGDVTIFLNGNVYNGVFVRNSRGPDTQRVLGTQKWLKKTLGYFFEND